MMMMMMMTMRVVRTAPSAVLKLMTSYVAFAVIGLFVMLVFVDNVSAKSDRTGKPRLQVNVSYSLSMSSSSLTIRRHHRAPFCLLVMSQYNRKREQKWSPSGVCLLDTTAAIRSRTLTST